MWRAIVLATAVYLLVGQIFPNTTTAVGGKGDWVTTSMNTAFADFNEDCVIDVVDDQMIAFRYASSVYNPPPYDDIYDSRYDVEPQAFIYNYPPPGFLGDDGDIDIKDVQFVFGRNFQTCFEFWDPQTSMGMYSLKGSSLNACQAASSFSAVNPSNYTDPVGTVFVGNATPQRLEAEATTHGFPILEHDGEQLIWAIGWCFEENVDAGENDGGGFPDLSVERMHVRSWRGTQAHVTWGSFEVATPHFDDDCWPAGHFVPQVYPYPERIYPGFSGSGFDAGREWVYKKFVTEGGHALRDSQYWGNRTAIKQGCKTEYPRSNGWVDFIEIP